ncbi:hypothetical protein [Streptomyces sp. NPDC051704]|uniref:hypothetical protein n=1 Tax=Streptomyces sp. NPDC051704 TaxID=3365671 RepID=UPI00379C810F
MSDHYQDIEVHTDATVEAALDALLAGHQAGLHSALASALDTRAGFAQIDRNPSEGWVVLDDTQAGRGITQHVRTSTTTFFAVYTESSTLAAAVRSVEEEVRRVESFIKDIEDHADLMTAPSRTRRNTRLALRLVLRELNRIGELLIDEEITKESAGTEFDLAVDVLTTQVDVWTRRVRQAPRTTWTAGMLDRFVERANATLQLRKLVVRLFEDADDTVLQLS